MAAYRNRAFQMLRNLSTLTSQSTRESAFSSSTCNNFLRAVITHDMHTPPPVFKSTSIRWRVSNSNAGANYSPVGRGNNNWSDKAPEDLGPLFPGCDYEHWLIVMDAPGEGKASKQEMINCFVKTLATVLGSEEAAIKAIYNVSTEGYFGFGCAISEETSQKLEGLPGVCFVLPDSYVDATHQDYGGELFIDGQVVPRSPERQRLIDAAMYKGNERPRHNDRSRARRRENQGRREQTLPVPNLYHK